MPEIIRKFTTFEDTNTRFDEWQSTISFCSDLINWIDNKNLKQVFEALNPLVQADDFVIIQQILPYFVYYAVRFNDDDSVVDKISEDICNFLKNGNYHQSLQHSALSTSWTFAWRKTKRLWNNVLRFAKNYSSKIYISKHSKTAKIS